MKKALLQKLFKNLVKKYEKKYINKRNLESKPKNIKTSFKSKKSIPLKEENTNKIVYNYVLPSLVKYLNSKILKRKNDAFDKIHKNVNSEKFCNLYKSWTEKKELEPKKELINRLKKIYKYSKTEGPLKLKLFNLLRKGIIHRLLEPTHKIGKVAGIMYITRLLIMQREFSHELFFRQLIRRWRYITFSKKLAMNKMKTIYKNLHMTYLEMANCLFGDEGQNEPSVIKEFERFGTSVGMWENEKPGEKTEEKFVKYMKTSYTFDPVEFEKYQSKFYPSEYEDVGEEYPEEEDEKEVNEININKIKNKKKKKNYKVEPKKYKK